MEQKRVVAFYQVGLFILLIALMACTSNIEVEQTPAAPPTPDNSTYSFTGSVNRGERFEHVLPNGLVFSLIPTEYAELGWVGWMIQIAPPTEPDHNYAGVVTPPFRGVNALQIIGWHFRNADNTGPNEGSVNAPQEKRDFLFVTNEGDYQMAFSAVDCIMHPSQCEDMDNREAFAIHENIPKSEGTLLITELELGNLIPEQQAWIEHMAFEVEIRWSAEEMK